MDPNTQQPTEQVQSTPPVADTPVEPTFEQLAPILPPAQKGHTGAIFGIFFATMIILGVTGGGAWYYLTTQIQPADSVTTQSTITPTTGASAQIIATSEEVTPETVPAIVEAEQLDEDFKELDQLLSTL